MSLLLDIRGLQVDFHVDTGTISAVSGASLSVKPHETVVLAGESGSGKTVTALSICRILPSNARITAGAVFFEDRELTGLEESLLRMIRGKDVSYIFQEPAAYLNPVYTIGNQIDEAVMLHQGKGAHDAGQVSLDLLAKAGFKDPQRIYRSYPHQLSGGMNQRAFIAMALSSKPKLLIADEPTTSLDATIEAQILKLLMELKDEYGFSLLFITHNLSIAKKIADRVYVMYQGRIVEEADRTAL
ncbi:MAG: ABC transporter ATP-binding protein, partial [Candidatus Omnitrophota bacterium]